METDPRICLYCDNLLGCTLLADTQGIFVPERAITQEHYRDCAEWAPIKTIQKNVRENLYGIQGEGCLRVLHQMPSVVMKDVKREEEENEMVGEMPNFAGMLRPNMTTEEREQQLRYETDEEGNVVVDDQNQRRPRPSYATKKFACDPSGHIKLDHSVGMFWSIDQVVKFILDSEVEQSLIVKAKKEKANSPAVTTAAPKETQMAGERRVLINRSKPQAQAAQMAEPPAQAPVPPPGGGPKPSIGGVKMATPPRRIAAGSAPVQEEPVQEPQAPQEDLVGALKQFALELREDVKVAMADTIHATTEKVNEGLGLMVAMTNRMEEIYGNILSAITIHHDLQSQTKGTMQYQDDKGEWHPLEEKFNKPNKILDYIDPQG